MAGLTSLNVLKNDGTTTVTFTGQVPSSGDGTPAVWQNIAVGTAQTHRPELRMSAKNSGDGSKRVVRLTFQYPTIATNSTTGLTSVVYKGGFSTELYFPKDQPVSDTNELVAQFCNLMGHASMKTYLQSGFAPT